MAYEGTPLWHAVDKAIAELVANGDPSELTPRRYIVGRICERVAGSDQEGTIVRKSDGI
jgi:hypothetical protein